MLTEELLIMIDNIVRRKYETQTIEIKAAHDGCPKKLYDTLSSFSNQTEGGIIVFGIDESANFAEVGVYDVQDLQKKVTEHCNQMTPAVRAVFTVAERNGKHFAAAEIPGLDPFERPCYYSGSGRMKGAYIRSGDVDEHMTEYEIYSCDAFKKKYCDDIRSTETNMNVLDDVLVSEYLIALKKDKPNLQKLSDAQILSLMGLTADNKPTLAAVLLFGLYPQATFPQLCITAVAVPGAVYGDKTDNDARFTDNKRIEGTLPQMAEEALNFVVRNMKSATHISGNSVRNETTYEYPVTAIREAVLNAIIHRDYSIHTEGMPITLVMYEDRLEIKNPGGLYGRMRIDDLGKVQPDTRNPKIATAMEVLHMTENRYSGIPTMIRECKALGLPAPEFSDKRGEFCVVFRKKATGDGADTERRILDFCSSYRTKEEIAEMLGYSTASYVLKYFITPLVEQGKLAAEKSAPRSHHQRYIASR